MSKATLDTATLVASYDCDPIVAARKELIAAVDQFDREAGAANLRLVKAIEEMIKEMLSEQAGGNLSNRLTLANEAGTP